VQNLEDLFYLLIGKSGQIFAFSQRFLTVEYLEEYQIFPMEKVVDILNLAMNFQVENQVWSFVGQDAQKIFCAHWRHPSQSLLGVL
jgi:hypothetical protein